MFARYSKYLPFYSRESDSESVRYEVKTVIAVAAGCTFLVFQALSLPDKSTFVEQYCWVMGAIITTSLLALYLATDIFRDSLTVINKMEGEYNVTDRVVDRWLSERSYIIAGCIMATLNTSTGHLLGVPEDFYVSPFALFMAYFGFILSGFTCGIGVQAILGVIALYVRFAPLLHFSLEPRNPDGMGGIKKLGDSLWFFAFLTSVVSVLISIYVLSVGWSNLGDNRIQLLLLFWISMPYIVAISIVLIPGLVVRRQVSLYKKHKTDQLKREKAEVYNSFKKFTEKSDDEIIEEKKKLNDKLADIQEELNSVKKMRTSHIDRG